MAISQRAKDLTENLYSCYGTGTGWLFGIPPDLRLAVEGIVQSVLDRVEDIKGGEQVAGKVSVAPQLLEALEMAVEAIANSDAKFCMAAIDRAYAAIEAARVK